jgi:O-antigen/teichoic acid export membrane protein
MNKEFGRNTFYSVAGFGVMMLCSFAFNYFVARKLGVSDYGVFMSFFYFLITFTQPINSLQLAVAKKTASESLKTGDGVKSISPTIFLVGSGVLAAFVAMSPMLVKLYHLPGILDAILGGAVIAAWLYLGAYRGVYQGGMKFLAYGSNYAIEGLVRAAVGVGLIFAGFGIGAAIGSSLAGAIIAVAVLIVPFLKDAFSKVSLKPDGALMKEFLRALFVLLPFG